MNSTLTLSSTGWSIELPKNRLRLSPAAIIIEANNFQRRSSLLLHRRWQRGDGFGLGFVIHAGQAEAEELEEFGAIAGHVGKRLEVFGADFRPQLGHGLLDVRAHFPVVDPHATG